MSLRTYRTYQALVLAGLGIFLFAKVMDGRILFYINQRFVILVLLAAIGLILLGQMVLRERPGIDDDLPDPHENHPARVHPISVHKHGGGEGRSGLGLWLLALPLLIGILIPARSLNASALQIRGINTASGLVVQGSSTNALEIPPNQRSVLEWIRAMNENPDAFALEGQPADVTGFVYHDLRLAADEFMVSRFSIACCVADAVALGMAVQWEGAADIPDNRWVRVRGTVHLTEKEGMRLLLIDAQQVELIPEPEQPYLFP